MTSLPRITKFTEHTAERVNNLVVEKSFKKPETENREEIIDHGKGNKYIITLLTA